MIEVRDLSVALGARAVLSDVSLTLSPGTITGLVGASIEIRVRTRFSRSVQAKDVNCDP